jgi:TetR/AcrR family transcriptional repressor of lmrAB and yxaGH operons
LYYYFPAGKDALGAAAVTFAGTGVSATLRQLRAETGNSREFIEQYCNLLAGWMENSNFKSGCPIATTLLETCPTSSTIQAVGLEVFENWTRIIGDVFLDEGYTVKQANAASLLVIAAVEGSLILSRTLSSVAPIHTIAAQLNRLEKA